MIRVGVYFQRTGQRHRAGVILPSGQHKKRRVGVGQGVAIGIEGHSGLEGTHLANRQALSVGDDLLPVQDRGSIDDAQDGNSPVRPSHDRDVPRIDERKRGQVRLRGISVAAHHIRAHCFQALGPAGAEALDLQGDISPADKLPSPEGLVLRIRSPACPATLPAQHDHSSERTVTDRPVQNGRQLQLLSSLTGSWSKPACQTDRALSRKISQIARNPARKGKGR